MRIWKNENDEEERNYISFNETNFQLFPNEANALNPDLRNGFLNENVKGVVRFKPNKDTNTIYGIDIRVDDVTIQELKKYVKGYFFVR